MQPVCYNDNDKKIAEMEVDLLVVGLPRNAGKNKKNIDSFILRNFDVKNMIPVFSLETTIDNPRSGEIGTFNYCEYFEWGEQPFLISLDNQIDNDCKDILDSVKLDPWNDDMKSLRNFLKYLICLKIAYKQWLRIEERSDILIVIRPDIIYDIPSERQLNKIRHQFKHNKDCYLTSFHQSWGGLNDRFAIIKGSAIDSYLNRFDKLLNFINSRTLWNGESFLLDSMDASSSLHLTSKIKIYRTRYDGRVHPERFDLLTAGTFKSLWKNWKARL